MTGSTASGLLVPDHTLLIGRDACGYITDIDALDAEGCGRDLLCEIDAMLEIIQRRSSARHASTRARTMAAELVAPLSLLCGTIEVVDLLHNLAINWIESLGDVPRFARQYHAGLEHAQNLLNATLADPSDAVRAEYDDFHEEFAELSRNAETEWTIAFNARAILRVQSPTTLAAILDVHRRDPVIVAIVDVENDGGSRTALRTPDLVA